MMMLNTLLMAAECFFGGSLILALAFLLAREKNASQRHLIFTGAFAVMLLLPFAAMLLPSHVVWQIATASSATVIPTHAAPAASGIDIAAVISGLCIVWLMGVIFVLSKAAYGAVTLIGLYRNSVPHIPEGLSCEKFRGLNWQLRIRTIPGDAGPITWGLIKPVVLLPKCSVTWPRARLEAVLLHEAAHVRRKDCLSRLIALFACALYWPNPLAWAAARAMCREGETAADDCVLSSGIKASAYAEHLVGLARTFSKVQPAYAGVSLAMAEPSMLDARVEAILNPSRSRRGVNTADVLKIAALGLTATAVMALVRPSLAEEKRAPAPMRVAQVEIKECPQTAQTVLAVPRTAAKQTSRVAIVSDDDRGAVALAPPPPPAPPAPAAAEAPAVPPAPPAPAAPPSKSSHVVMRMEKDGEVKEWRWDMPHLDAKVRAEIRRAMQLAKSEEMHALAGREAEIRRATAEAQQNAADVMRQHADELRQANDMARQHADVMRQQADAIRQANSIARQAMAKVNVSAIVSHAMEAARPAMEQALSKAKVDVKIDVNTDDNEN